MDEYNLARIGVFGESRLEVKVNANVMHMTQEMARAQVDVANARYVAPVRTLMRYLVAITISLLVFILIVAILAKLMHLSDNLAIAIVAVAGAAIATPLGIALAKLTKQLIPSVLDPPSGGSDKGGE